MARRLCPLYVPHTPVCPAGLSGSDKMPISLLLSIPEFHCHTRPALGNTAGVRLWFLAWASLRWAVSTPARPTIRNDVISGNGNSFTSGLKETMSYSIRIPQSDLRMNTAPKYSTGRYQAGDSLSRSRRTSSRTNIRYRDHPGLITVRNYLHLLQVGMSVCLAICQ